MIDTLKACLLGACRNVAFNCGRNENQRWVDQAERIRWDPNIL